MSGETRHVWVILCEQGFGASWTDLAFWGVAESYEAAVQKLRAVVQGSFSTSSTSADDVTVWTGRMTWRIKRVAL